MKDLLVDLDFEETTIDEQDDILKSEDTSDIDDRQKQKQQFA